MKTLELEIVQGFFFYPHYAFRYIFVAQRKFLVGKF